jgi:hypothetical protein
MSEFASAGLVAQEQSRPLFTKRNVGRTAVTLAMAGLLLTEVPNCGPVPLPTPGIGMEMQPDLRGEQTVGTTIVSVASETASPWGQIDTNIALT